MALDPIVSVNNRTPGMYLTVSLGVGARSPEGERKVLLYGNKTSSGSATAETAYEVTSEDDARDMFGAGSELHQMVRAAYASEPSAPVHAAAVAESAGTAASDDFTFSGTATKGGTVLVQVLDYTTRVAFASGDAAEDVASAVSSAIVNQTDWPVTASDAVAVVTLTCKNKGPRGNNVAVKMTIVESGTGISVASTAGTGYLANGATLDDGQTALDNVAATRYHYHVTGNTDATELGKWVTHVTANADPTEGRRELVVSGSVDSKATVETLATAKNEPRLQIVASQGNYWTPAMLGAAMASVRSVAEANDPAHNFNGDVLASAPVPDESNYWTAAEVTSMLNNGVTPLQPTHDGKLAIVRSVTSKSQDSVGGADYRVLDTCKVVVPDYVADDIAVGFPARFPNRKLEDDNANGDPPEDPSVVTPSIARDYLLSRMKSHEAAGLVSNVDEWADQLIVEIAASPAGRLLGSIPCDVVEWLSQLDADLRQIG